MHLKHRPAFCLLLIPLLCGACSVEQAELTGDIGESAAELILNQGVQLQGVQLQGVQLQGVQLQGVQLQGVQLQGTELRGAELIGFKPNNDMASGADLIGATMTGILSNYDELTLRIDDVTATDDPKVYAYTVSYDTGLEWKSLCGYNTDESPVKALALEGLWDGSSDTLTGGDFIDEPERMTFACRSAVLAKCAEAGYKPWESDVEECLGGNCRLIPMRSYHQACTRMMRQDLCGTGKALTTNGTAINLYDNEGIQEDDTSVSWPLEAEWTSEGALCIRHIRWTSAGTAGVDAALTYVNANCPALLTSQSISTCGSSSSTYFTSYGFSTQLDKRVLLRNESVAPPE